MPEKFKFDFSKEDDQKRFDALPPKERTEVVADAQEEASKIQEILKTGDALNYGEAEWLLENDKRIEKMEADEKLSYKEGVDKLLVPVEQLLPGIKLGETTALTREESRGPSHSFSEAFANTLPDAIRTAFVLNPSDSGHYRVPSENPRIEKRLRNGFKDQIVVDLGAGGTLYGYSAAMLGRAKGYVSVDYYRGISGFFKHGFNSLRDGTVNPMGAWDVPLIPLADVKEDMLTFLRRLPDNSVSIICSGIDMHVIPNDLYRDEVNKEITRVLSSQGLLVTHHSDIGADKKAVDLIYRGGSGGIYEKKNTEQDEKITE